jgi:hypothetical protein
VRQCCTRETIQWAELTLAPKRKTGRGSSDWNRNWSWCCRLPDRNHEWTDWVVTRPVNYHSWVNANTGHCATGNGGANSRICCSNSWCCWFYTGSGNNSGDQPDWADTRDHTDSVDARNNAYESRTEQHAGNDESINSRNDDSVDPWNNSSEWRHKHNAGNYHST